MDAPLLSPLLGRLIDRAKAAAAETAGATGPATGGSATGESLGEGVALLLADETVVAAGAVLGQPAGPESAASLALAQARAHGGQAVEAVAVTVAGTTSETILPSAATRQVLATVDTALPLVLKVHGRWVVRLLSELQDTTDCA